MITRDQYRDCVGRTLVGSDGGKIGKISDVYMDSDTGEPEWFTVTTGLFGRRVSFVPTAQASFNGDDVAVPYDKDQVKDAPNAEADGHLSTQEESSLYRHYGMNYAGTPSGQPSGGGNRSEGRSSDDAMTRSEEELRAGTADKEAGVARLRKWVEVEHVTTTVPVKKEKAVIEREPITEANRGKAMEGPELTESEHEVVLHEEEPVIEKRTVPKERVRLDTETETEEREVAADLRKERIEAEGEAETRRR